MVPISMASMTPKISLKSFRVTFNVNVFAMQDKRMNARPDEHDSLHRYT